MCSRVYSLQALQNLPSEHIHLSPCTDQTESADNSVLMPQGSEQLVQHSIYLWPPENTVITCTFRTAACTNSYTAYSVHTETCALCHFWSNIILQPLEKSKFGLVTFLIQLKLIAFKNDRAFHNYWHPL